MKATVVIRGQAEAAIAQRRPDGSYIVTCKDGFVAGGDTLEEACDLATTAHKRKATHQVGTG